MRTSQRVEFEAIKNPAQWPGLVEAIKPQMERGTAPAATQLHAMADITVTTGLKNSMVKLGISVILLPSFASEITVAISISGVV